MKSGFNATSKEKYISLNCLLIMGLLMSFLFVSCEADDTDTPAKLGTSVNKLSNAPSCWPFCSFPIEIPDCDNDISLDVPGNYVQVDMNNLSAEAPCFNCLVNCFTVNGLKIPGGFDSFEFKIDATRNSMYSSFKNDECGCDDVLFNSSHFAVFKGPDCRVLIRILSWDAVTGTHRFIQIEGSLDANDCNIRDAKLYFGNFPEFGIECPYIYVSSDDLTYYSKGGE